ncbi:MAG: Crp/Fnr family transcriptional regulator [Snowella sp.]|nr:Crp/Fnr family transcriptional regulator [Snowella sp.]
MLLTDSLLPTHSQKTNATEGRRLHFYDKGELIPLAEEGIWQVYRGVVQLSQLAANGEEILLGWVHPENFFGLWLTSTQLATYQARSISDVYLRWYPVLEIENTPKLAQLVLAQLVQRMRQTEALLAIAGLKRVDERLQELLKLLAQDLGQPVTEGTRIKVRLTHQMLANAIGTTRVTITRLLGEFQTQGWIRFDSDRHLVITPNVIR